MKDKKPSPAKITQERIAKDKREYNRLKRDIEKLVGKVQEE